MSLIRTLYTDAVVADVEPSSILENRFPKESPQGYAAQSNKPQKEDSPPAAEVTGMFPLSPCYIVVYHDTEPSFIGILDPSRIAQYLFFNPALAIFNGQNAIKMSIANIVSEVLREVRYPFFNCSMLLPLFSFDMSSVDRRARDCSVIICCSPFYQRIDLQRFYFRT